MSTLAAIRELIPEPAKDIRLNLSAVLEGELSLSPGQRWGVAVACAIASRHAALRDAVLRGAEEAAVGRPFLEDAQAAAALMAMNNVYYRFRHFMGREEYDTKPARLRMQRIAKPSSSKVDFELMCLAVSAINGCQACVVSHEKVCVEGGLSIDQVNDAVRIAATMSAAAQSLELGALSA
jgi:alkyl hydroperoxide reductase subunit D